MRAPRHTRASRRLHVRRLLRRLGQGHRSPAARGAAAQTSRSVYADKGVLTSRSIWADVSLVPIKTKAAQIGGGFCAVRRAGGHSRSGRKRLIACCARCPAVSGTGTRRRSAGPRRGAGGFEVAEGGFEFAGV